MITHTHYDHINNIPHLIPRIDNPPLYTTLILLCQIRSQASAAVITYNASGCFR
jgi:phosphoribosyl 1,2-cyclic phosphodiesterase